MIILFSLFIGLLSILAHRIHHNGRQSDDDDNNNNNNNNNNSYYYCYCFELTVYLPSVK